ncbi:MAG: hypothetical protein JZD41_05275 [Thermoproteus sp.]|nr:hypothetical protein [Thermoproteus sp.]
MLAFGLGFGLEIAIWLLGLAVLVSVLKRGFGGLIQSFAVMMILPAITTMILVFAEKFPVYAGGPIILPSGVGEFWYGTLLGAVVAAMINFVIALIGALAVSAKKLLKKK